MPLQGVGSGVIETNPTAKYAAKPEIHRQRNGRCFHNLPMIRIGLYMLIPIWAKCSSGERLMCAHRRD
jgi:hypothetical protein